MICILFLIYRKVSETIKNKISDFILILIVFTGRYITVKKNHNMTDESLEHIGKHRPVSLALIQCHGDFITAKGLRGLFRACANSLKVGLNAKRRFVCLLVVLPHCGIEMSSLPRDGLQFYTHA